MDADALSETLNGVARGDSAAIDRLLPVVYQELRLLAASYLKGERPGHTLQPTALAHEVYLRLARREDGWQGRTHFMSVAARAMRSVLVDHARRKGSEKRGGEAERVELDTALVAFKEPSVDVLELDEALTTLSAMDSELGRIVELRFFAGMSIDETAAVLGVSAPTIARRWRVARMWLWGELSAARS